MAGFKRPYDFHMPALNFRVPQIVGRQYITGWQPRSDGETSTQLNYQPNIMPWPNVVQPLNTLAHHEGIPRERGVQAVVNRTTVLPQNYFWINGIVEKSKG